MVTLHTIDGGTVNAINDALLYDFVIGQNGIATGATVTSEGALLLHIDSGWGVIKGRIFSIEAETVNATPSTSGTVKGRLILQIDITNTTNPIVFVTQAAATLPALQQENINGNGTIFQLPIATYDVNEVAVSNLQMVAPVAERISQMYPVGSIYMSVNDTNPHELFGGTWKQLKDRFLLASGDSYQAGSTGGEATHILTQGEMPRHSHNTVNNNILANELSGTTITFKSGSDAKVSQGQRITYETGGNQPHNNMPPYLVVYMWQRTA